MKHSDSEQSQPKVPVITLIAERPTQKKHETATFVRDDLCKRKREC